MTDRALPPGPLGGRHPRPDALAKARGLTRYAGDLGLPGMLHAALAVSPVASAQLRGLDLAAARAVDGVVAVLTAADLPAANQIGVVFPDHPLLVAGRVRRAGERRADVVV
ncbi:MAG TPA: xanthine dehydrogenase subunit D, partial [Thermoanaerobaculia bacterium]|nr:xanthine dehydrogenase subunit D [Thermoanaerobaculia bacterium]